MVVEELLGLSGPIHHLVIDAGDVEHQAHHQTEAWAQNIEGDSESRSQTGQRDGPQLGHDEESQTAAQFTHRVAECRGSEPANCILYSSANISAEQEREAET